MAFLKLLRLWLLTSLLSCASANIIETIREGIADNIVNPVERVVVSGLSSQCSNIKALLGIDSEELVEEDEEPDVDELTLDYISNDYNESYPINTAAEDIIATGKFHYDQDLYIFLHGFTDDPDSDTFGTVREALFSAHQANVLALDAHPLIGKLYLRSSTYVKFIGQKLAEVLVALVNNNVDPKQIHIIGHSLGGQIASYTGKAFTNMTEEKIGQITGLDPAGPCFDHLDETNRLQPGDATFVDVIHTNAGVYGIDKACGDVDYWPNGGKTQPGCIGTSCNHSRAWKYYAESVKDNEAFEAVACDSWDDFKNGDCSDVTSYMGFATNAQASGYQFYLRTASDSPYGLGHDGITNE